MSLTRDYDLVEIAEALGMSERWVRQRVKDGAAHQRYGQKIKMTAEQVEALRASHTKRPTVTPSITTGRKRSTGRSA